MMHYRLALFGLNVVLLASIGWTLMLPLPTIASNRSGNRQPSVGSITFLSATAISPSSLGRPLFRATSRSNTTLVSGAAVTHPQLRLVGVLLGEHRVGFVEQLGVKLRRIVEGDEIEGWTVQAIDARALMLSRDDRSVTYRLDPAGNGESH